MPGVSIEYQPLTDTIDLYNERIGNSNLLFTAYRRNTSRLLSRWKSALKIEPAGAPEYYPLHYKSAKQRRKVQSLRRERGGGPYIRTHNLSNGWQGSVDPVESGGALSMYNTAYEAGFVYGDFDNSRQPMFQGENGGVPWLNPFDVSAPYFDEAETILASTWHTILDPNAGI